MQSANIFGSIAALITPMLPDEQIDWPALDRLIDWHIAEGTHGLLIGSAAGESVALTEPERHALVSRVVRRIDGRIGVIGAIETNCTRTAIEQARAIESAGADAGQIIAPFYNKPTQEGVLRHFLAVADQATLPLIILDAPAVTGCTLHTGTLKQLIRHDNIAGITDQTGDLQHGIELLGLVGDACPVFIGTERLALPMLLRGARGVISLSANIEPEAVARMCSEARYGDTLLARELHELLAPLAELLAAGANPIATKWALCELGRISAGIRLPLTALAPALRPALLDVLRRVAQHRSELLQCSDQYM